MPDSRTQIERPWKSRYVRIWIGLAIIVIGSIACWKFGHLLSMDLLVSRETALRRYQMAYPLPVLGFSFIIYVIATGFSLPGA
ncbi:MAG TPA: TVP38/TMEM64 family protein, partial [Verrucomicrobiales bacterium]|nr:TVP38/TMEM64 family protein [Verrucomicrobiales bacterium]